MNEIYIVMLEGYDLGEEGTPGFFETARAAEEWVLAQNAIADAKYVAAMAKYEPERILYLEHREAADAAWATYKAAIEAVGGRVGFKPHTEEPSSPRRSNFFDNYEIIMVKKEEN